MHFQIIFGVYNNLLTHGTTILTAPLLKLTDIISSHKVNSEVECLFNCFNENKCIGFKYKSTTNRESRNCQLSKSTSKNNVAYYNDQGWQFFIDARNVSVNYLVLIVRIIIM